MQFRPNLSRGAGAALVASALLGACAYPQSYPAYSQAPAGPAYNPPPQYAQRGSVAPASYVGTIASIDLMRPEARQASPVGAIAGAVIGGLLGNQVGAGSGKAVATVAGVAGGALAGNEIGKRAANGSEPDLYRIGVRYDNGSVQYIDVTDPAGLRIGERVRVGADGQISRT